MAFRPNYGRDRAERNRLKAEKRQEKLDKRAAEVARRKAERAEPERGPPGTPPAGEPS
jgi:hypothetical protein